MALTRTHCLRAARGAISAIRPASAISSTAPALLRRYASDHSVPKIEDIAFSEGTDLDAAIPKLHSLLKGKQWALRPTKDGIDRSYYFKDFKGAWGFMSSVVVEARARRHDPEWSNFYNHVYVRWTTHKPKGLSILDLNMALACDQLAAEHELAPLADQGLEDAHARALLDTGFDSHWLKTRKSAWKIVDEMAEDSLRLDSYRLWSHCYDKLYISNGKWKWGDESVTRTEVAGDSGEKGWELFLRELAEKATSRRS